ncbi:hypothetical protein PIROE2DRAFT_16951 [Piromyces sp. E2]|nr:hypothetical protein PIROE2DRAFT_16951 [Piromyces sp. E2]|eukprot:OUM57915.1 hypothetical protein PIROE2DRAFT_16951 [Piromyces sp. E2]
MSLETESDNEWFEENNLLIQNESKTENESMSYENKGEKENPPNLLSEIDNFDFNDSLSSRLDAFQEKINAMLAEGNKMLNQNVTRKNVDLPYYSSETRRRHRHHSHGKQKVAFSSDTINSDDNLDVSSDSQLNISNTTTNYSNTDNNNTVSNNNNTTNNNIVNDNNNNNNNNNNSNNSNNNNNDNNNKRLSISSQNITESLSKNKTNNKYEKSKKSTTDSTRKLSGKDMLQDAISFSKLVLNNDINKVSDLKSKRSVSPNPSTIIPSEEKIKNSSKRSNSKNGSSKKGHNIDSLLSQSLSDGESILQTNELELLRIELKEVKEKNKQLQQENMNLKIKNSSLSEKQKQQEQQIEKLKQKNSQLQRLLSEANNTNSNFSTPMNSRPSSPFVESGSQDMLIRSPSTDSDWNNSITLSPSQIHSKLNTIKKFNGSISDVGSDDNDEKSFNSIKKIKDIENRRRLSFPQKFYSIDNIESSIGVIPLKKEQQQQPRARSNSNISFYQTLPKNKSLLHSSGNKRHSMFADIKSYDRIIEGWKQIENKDSINSSHHTKNMNENKLMDSNSRSNIIENVKIDIGNNNHNNNININNTKTNSKRYSFVYPSNNDKTRRYSYLSDISPLGEIKYDVNEYIDKLNGPEVANKKTRVRKISESYANDLRHRENILKHCSLSPPKFKYSDMKDLDLMTGYHESLSSTEQKIDKAHKRKSILDQISYIRIDDESINNIKSQVQRRMSINKTLPVDIHHSSFETGSQSSENNNGGGGSGSDHGNLIYGHSPLLKGSHLPPNDNDNHDPINDDDNKVEIKHLNNRLSVFKNQIQNVQKDLTDMLECEKRIQDLLLPINNSQQ